MRGSDIIFTAYIQTKTKTELCPLFTIKHHKYLLRLILLISSTYVLQLFKYNKYTWTPLWTSVTGLQWMWYDQIMIKDDQLMPEPTSPLEGKARSASSAQQKSILTIQQRVSGDSKLLQTTNRHHRPVRVTSHYSTALMTSLVPLIHKTTHRHRTLLQMNTPCVKKTLQDQSTQDSRPRQD